MEQGSKLTAIVCVVFMGVILQVVLSCIPPKDSPTRTVRELATPREQQCQPLHSCS